MVPAIQMQGNLTFHTVHLPNANLSIGFATCDSVKCSAEVSVVKSEMFEEVLAGAKTSDIQALLKLAAYFESGAVTKSDSGKSQYQVIMASSATVFHLYSEAALSENPEANYKLGSAFERGEGTRKDLASACLCYEKAAVAGHGTAARNLTVLAIQGEDKLGTERALEILERLALRGNSDVMLFYGAILLPGFGPPCVKADARKAIHWIDSATDDTDAETQHNLGLYFHSGSPHFPADPLRARRLLLASARLGHSQSQHIMGILSLESAPLEAAKWFEKAAMQGSRDSLVNLAVLHADGGFGEPNLALAYFWARLAYFAGENMEVFTSGIAGQLSRDEVARIELAVMQRVDVTNRDEEGTFEVPQDGTR